MNKYITEFIGTMFLVIGAALGGGIGASLVIMAMIYAGFHISGAHYNPAITLAVVIRKRIKINEASGYWTAQIAGAVAAALIVAKVFKSEGSGMGVVSSDGVGAAIVAEFLGTLALSYVVLNVATAKGTEGNSFYGIAIAGTVLAMTLTIGPFSGAAYNPAVAIGLSIQKTFVWPQLWIYLLGSFAGAACGALIFNLNNK